MTAKIKPDFSAADAVVKIIRPMLKAVAELKWDTGDALFSHPLHTVEMKYAAEQVGYEVSTLKVYLEVSTVFPAGRRDLSLAWGVFRQLARVTSGDKKFTAAAWQDDFLSHNPHATSGDAERAANARIKELRSTHQNRRPVATMELLGTTFVATANPDGSVGTLEIQGAAKVGKVQPDDMTGSFRVSFAR